jgi:putative addiction module antidote
MVTLKIRKIGNSLGVVLPKEVLARLRAGEGDEVFFTESPDGFRLTPYAEELAEEMRLAERIMREDRDLLRELSKR